MSSDRIRDVFPADDPEARFVVAMSMARNDVKYCVQQAVRAGANDDPEFWYLVRVSYGHPIEGLEALGRWRQHNSDVQAFLRRLPQDIGSRCGRIRPHGADTTPRRLRPGPRA